MVHGEKKSENGKKIDEKRCILLRERVKGLFSVGKVSAAYTDSLPQPG